MAEDGDCAFFGVVVTYRRPDLLRESVAKILNQDENLTRLVVVDCDPAGSAEPVIRALGHTACEVEYLGLGVNKGPAGGRAAGLRRVLAVGGANDWVMLFDDDDAPPVESLVSELVAVANAALALDPATAGVGLRGARFDSRRGRTYPVVDLSPQLVRVDHLHGGFFPTYRLAAVEQVGFFAEELFYGFEELEYGLRLTKAGFSLYMTPSLYGRFRRLMAHPEPLVRPRTRVASPSWKVYYSLRNLLYILLRTTKQPMVAARVALIRGIVKPLINLPVEPSASANTLRLNLRAIADVMSGRMGKTIDPDDADA